MPTCQHVPFDAVTRLTPNAVLCTYLCLTPGCSGGHRAYFVYPRRVRKSSYNSDFWRFLEMKRETAETQKRNGKFVPHPDPILKGRPTINAFCYDCYWDDGKPREVCTMALTFVATGVRVSLNDKEGKRSCYTDAPTLEEALNALEVRLASGDAPWRPWKR